MNDIKVSIVCNAYNHEKYIRDALEGFVSQKTNFRYEVLVHDDASTDKTADIIREYETKYPDIIKPIYQTENQFSQGVRISSEIQYPRAIGKYIALCEGDDRWIDPSKLQKQVDFLENNRNCSLVCHNSKRIDNESGEISVENPISNQGYVSPEELIVGKKEIWLATASLVFRKEVLKYRYSFYNLSPVGDYALRLLCLAQGDVYYIDEVMSEYNYKVPGSWSSGAWAKINRGVFDSVEFLRKYNECTEYKYDKFINESIKIRIFANALNSGDIKQIKSDEMKELYNKISVKQKLRTYLQHYCPRILSLKSKLRKK